MKQFGKIRLVKELSFHSNWFQAYFQLNTKHFYRLLSRVVTTNNTPGMLTCIGTLEVQTQNISFSSTFVG